MIGCTNVDCPCYPPNNEVPYLKGKSNSILWVLDAPTDTDAYLGKLLSGSDSSYLYSAIKHADLNADDIFFASAIRCKIDKSTLPTKQLNTILKCCKLKLDRVIQYLKPKLIIASGELALKQLCKLTGGVKKNRGLFRDLDKHPIFITYSPKLCIDNESFKLEFESDLLKIRDFINEGYCVAEQKVIVEQIDDLASVLPKDLQSIAIDTETQGLDWLNPNGLLISFSVCFNDTHAYQIVLNSWAENVTEADFFIEVTKKEGHNTVSFSVPIKRHFQYFENLKLLGEILKSPSIRKYMFNGQFDLCFIRQEYLKAFHTDLNISNFAIDVQAAAHLIDENAFGQTSLEAARKYFTEFKNQYSVDFDSSVDKSNMILVDQKELAYYAALDAYTTFMAALGIKTALLSEEKRLQNYFVRFVMPTLTYALPTLTFNGGYINKAEIPKVKLRIAGEVQETHKATIELIPQKIKDRYVFGNGSSKPNPQALRLSRNALIRDTIFDSEGFGVKPLDNTKGGSQPSIGAETRSFLKGARINNKVKDFINKYEQWSALNVLYTRYLKNFEASIKSDCRIHPTYAIVTTSTGRTCLAKGTPIYVLDAREKVAIEDIRPGDCVWSFDENVFEPVPSQVSWSGTTKVTNDIVRVYYQTQGNRATKYIDCTPDHLFLLRNGKYQTAETLLKGHRLAAIERFSSNKFTLVLGVSRLKQTTVMYDLTIDGPPNFIANGVCVHNSTQNPSFQNLPKRGVGSKIIRKLIIPEPGNVIVSMDYSQNELRWCCALSGDEVMQDVYRSNGDLHTKTALALLNKDIKDVTEDELKSARHKAKAVNFSLLYGTSVRGFQKYVYVNYNLDITYDEAEAMMNIFFSTYPRIKEYHRSVIKFAHKNKYVQSPFGRKRRLPGISSQRPGEIARCERQALNHAIQSAASDTALVALNELLKQEVLNPKEAKPIIFVHDELVFEVCEAKLDYYIPIIRGIMENPPLKELFGIILPIPLKVDTQIGQNYADLVDYPTKNI